MGDRYIKKAIPVEVEFANEDGRLATLEGQVDFMAGDAILTGVAKERWPVRRARFEQIYQPLPPTVMGERGSYIKKPLPVHAREAVRQETVAHAGGALQAQAGDWIVRSPEGWEWVVARKLFLETYRALD